MLLVERELINGSLLLPECTKLSLNEKQLSYLFVIGVNLFFVALIKGLNTGSNRKINNHGVN